jgi:hypothetical protein
MQVKKMMQELKWKLNYFWTYASCYKWCYGTIAQDIPRHLC